MEEPTRDPSAQEQALNVATLEGFLLELQLREILDDGDNISLWSGKDDDEVHADAVGMDSANEDHKSNEPPQADLANEAVPTGSEHQWQSPNPPKVGEYVENGTNNRRHRAESTTTASTTRCSTDKDTSSTSHGFRPQTAQDSAHRQFHQSHPCPLMEQIAEQNPDMMLDFPNVSVDELEMELHNLTARVTVEGRIGNLVKVSTGVNVNVGDLCVSMKGVQASALLVARLDNLKQMMDKALEAAVQNPDFLSGPADQARQPPDHAEASTAQEKR